MKKARVYLAAVLLVVGFTQVGFSQNHQKQFTKGEKTEVKKERISNLSEAQEKQIEDIKSDFQLKREEIKKNEALTKEERRDAFKEIQELQRAEINKVLTEEQLAQMENHRQGKDFKGKKKGKRKGDSSFLIEKMDAKLSLSEGQKTDIKNIMEGFSEKRKTAFGKDAEVSKEEKRKVFSDIRQAQDEAILAVLSEGQRDIWQKHLEERKQEWEKKGEFKKGEFKKGEFKRGEKPVHPKHQKLEKKEEFKKQEYKKK